MDKIKYQVEVDPQVINDLKNANIAGSMHRYKEDGKDVVAFVRRQKPKPYGEMHPNERRSVLPNGFVKADDLRMNASLTLDFASVGREYETFRKAFDELRDAALKLLAHG